MRTLLIAIVVVATLTLGCAPGERAGPAPEPTATPTDTISTMDFESGEVDHPVTDSETPEHESTPDQE